MSGERQSRARIWIFLIRKGGSGKTTSSVNFAAALVARYGRRVLLVDLDPQANATTHMGINSRELTRSITTIFTTVGVDPHSVIVPAHFTIARKTFGLDVLPASADLDNTDLGMQATQVGIFKPIIEALEGDYDDIVIDTRPTRSLLTISALIPATHAVIPMEVGVFALDGLEGTLLDIQQVRVGLNPQLKVVGILPTRVREATNLSRAILGSAGTRYEHLLMRRRDNGQLLFIRDSVRIGEAPVYGMPAIAYDPMSEATLDYIRFTEVLHAEK